MLFNIFKPTNYKEEVMDYNTTPSVDNVKVDPKNSYTVGFDNEGDTVLRISSNSLVSTITLTPSGVQRLIRMLEATLPNADDWK
jgi:hypothetical protein